MTQRELTRVVTRRGEKPLAAFDHKLNFIKSMHPIIVLKAT